jgi:hypothetical protein
MHGSQVFINMPDRFAISDVNAIPRLYDGVAVIWKGLPANIEMSEAGTNFELLVGYHDKRKLDGIVAVRAPFELRLPPDRPVEVLARVKATSGGFILECVAVHGSNYVMQQEFMMKAVVQRVRDASVTVGGTK